MKNAGGSERRWSRRGLLKAAGASAGASGVMGSASGESTSVEDTTAGEEVWSSGLDGSVWTGPSVVDGMVYVNSARSSYALTAHDGQRMWSLEEGSLGGSMVVVGNAAFFGRRNLYAVDRRTGEEQWKKELERPFPLRGTPAVYASKLYIAYTNSLWALEARSGTSDRPLATPDSTSSTSSPVVTQNSVYYGSPDGTVYSFDTDSKPGDSEGTAKRWTYEGSSEFHTPAIYEDTVYVGSRDNRVHAIDDETGEQRWTFDTDGRVSTCPTVYDGVVYVGSEEGRLYAVDADSGSELWRYPTDDSVKSSPTVAGGTVYFGSNDGKLHTVDRHTGQPNWTFRTEGTVFSSPTVVDGVVYFGSNDERMYAVNAGTDESSVGTRVKQGPHGHHHVYHERRSTGDLEFEEGLPGFGFLAAGAAVSGGAWLKYRSRSDKENR